MDSTHPVHGLLPLRPVAGSVIHVNESLSVLGGVEVYITQLQGLLHAAGWQSDWVSIVQVGTVIRVDSANPQLVWEGLIHELHLAPFARWVEEKVGLFHVHSLSSPSILKRLFEIAPVVRTAHEPRIMCPGHGKFWVNSESACEKAWGWHCVFHAYRERCCPRNPASLLRAMTNTRFERMNVSRYSCVIANSEYIASEIRQAGMAPRRLEVVPYFAEEVPPDDYAGSVGHRILFVGRLSRSKGLHYLLNAFVKVISEVPSAKLDIAGSGIDQGEFQSLADRLGVASSVVFHGWSDRTLVKKLLRECRVVAFPSIYPEAFGIVGIEAMMHARPVVAFDVGGVKDWLDDGVTGILVAPRETDALALALLRLLGSNETCRRMGFAARAQAKEKFSAERHLAALIGVYEDALSGDRVRDVRLGSWFQGRGRVSR
jgi:glycosyltransferase involved in cell wall biosynthesis